MIEKELKQKVLDQINSFVNHQNSNKEPKRYELRYFVATDIATDRAKFFGYIHNLKIFNCKSIIDLTFGSANLTAHLLLDNDIEFTRLVLNDKNFDNANFTEELEEINADIKGNDILDSNAFDDEKYDLVVFNPQFGGGAYPEGDLGVKRYSTDFMFHKYEEDLETAFREKFDLSDCTFSKDDDQRKISIHSGTLTVGDMDKRFSKIKVFNYYDVFYQSKTNNPKGESSKLVQFRKTFDKLSKDETTIVFFGKLEDYRMFFRDFLKCDAYITDEKDKSLFIGHKSYDEDDFQCYIKDGLGFIESDCERRNTVEQDDIDLSSILDEIHIDLKDLKSLDGGELFVLEDKSGINTEIAVPETKKDKQKPFKNFLLGFINKETR
ncbi:MAG: hypothetical protein M0Q24_01405 [Sulfurimonas sp.]|uniref:hypothetical protein n=1 Tax=Sulfurimonas sp. TaxID=2022749 RepID=UPI0025D298C7|nr:hypothetical protein [Sulfurimonas sp.]MCK9490719.1 hypothetical protein [Sulfurimonas sp.]